MNHNTRQLTTYLMIIPWSLEALGGVNQVVINLARESVKFGDYEPLVLINDWDATDPVFGEQHGVKIVRWRLRAYKKNMGKKELLAYKFWELKFSRRFRKFCHTRKVAAINFHFPGMSAFSVERAVSSLMPHMPLIYSFHGSDLTSIEQDSLHKDLWQRVLANSRSVTACSNDLSIKISKYFDNKVSCLVVHNGLDVNAFRANAKHSTKGNNFYILSVGKYEIKKGQDVLIEAFAQLVDQFPDLGLVLVGANSDYLAKLKLLCWEKNIEHRVEFHIDIPHEKIASFYHDATIFCLPSRIEPFGIVILEAASFTLPVVASRVGGVGEIIQHDYNGWLVESGQPVELERALRFCLENPKQANEAALRLHEHVEKSFSWASAYQKMVSTI